MAEETTATNTTTGTSQNVQNASQDTQTTSTSSNNVDTSQKAQDNPQIDIEKLIQKAVDRATNKLGNDNKKLREQVDTLRREKMTDDEIKKLELADREADIADREAKLQEKINREFALKAIKDAGLDDGGSNSLKLIDFVVCDTEEDTQSRVKAFSDLVDSFVRAEVDKTFKTNGRNPNQSIVDYETKQSTSVPELLGKMSAERQKESNDILKHYLGGKK